MTWDLDVEGKAILRGCIGTFAANQLSESLVKYALVAALHDKRFPPIAAKEVPSLLCTISLLTDFEKIEDPLDWQVGLHGIEIDFDVESERVTLMIDQHYRGTYLPGVS